MSTAPTNWLYYLASGDYSFTWWPYGSEDTAAVAELRNWLGGPGATRLRTASEPDLAIRAELLALPDEECWAHPYWYGPSVTD